MNNDKNHLVPFKFSAVITLLLMLVSSSKVNAQCVEVASGLRTPLGITSSNLNNLIVSETGNRLLHSGRLSIIDQEGNRRTLLDGLPSDINDVNEASGPAGVAMKGRTIYLAIGIGNSIQAGPFPGAAVGNPNPSSALYSSVLAVHFSANVEKTTSGFTLTTAGQTALANGEKVTLDDNEGGTLMIEQVANFPNYTPNPLPTFPVNVRGSNPFDLVINDDQIYVTDGGQNMVRKIDLLTGGVTTLTLFAPVPNPFFPALGGPVIDAVPTGIRYADGQLLVTLFRGVPFPPGVSQVMAVDPISGSQSQFIGGRKTAIDVLPISDGIDTDYLVLQHASLGLFFSGPGQVLRFETTADAPTVVADCLTRPTSMTFDEKSGTLYVTELGGRVVGFGVL